MPITAAPIGFANREPRVSGALAVAALALRRVRGHPGRWLLALVGVMLATAYAGGLLAESRILADQTARAALRQLPADQAAVRLIWPGIVTPAVGRHAVGTLRGLGLQAVTEVVLMNPVRLGSTLVRPAAITPLGAWAAPAGTGPCRMRDCPMLLAAGSRRKGRLEARGARGAHHRGRRDGTALADSARVQARGRRFTGAGSAQRRRRRARTADRTGRGLPHPQLAGAAAAGLAARLAARRARGPAASEPSRSFNGEPGQFSLQAPFAALDGARAAASSAPPRLLLAGGSAIVALLLFLVLAAGTVRPEIEAELERLRAAGALPHQRAVLIGTEALLLAAGGVAAGALLAVGAALVLAAHAGEPGLPLLRAQPPRRPRSCSGSAERGSIGGLLLSALLVLPGRAAGDVAAVAAVAALGMAVLAGGTGSGLALLLAPLACVAAGLVVFRVCAAALPALERVPPRGSLSGRLALIGLARAPLAPALAIAFLAVATSVGGFALALRATISRAAGDGAADRVPLDALLAPGPDLRSPLDRMPLEAWATVARGGAYPVIRTDASYPAGAETATVPALGVPGAALARIHGWRSGDGPAPPPALARRLGVGVVANRGPPLPPGATELRLRAAASVVAVEITADLRASSGALRRVTLGSVAGRGVELRGRVPPGRWNLASLELGEPAGLEATAGHQNAENPAGSQTLTGTVTLGPLVTATVVGKRRILPLGSWRGVGSAAAAAPHGAGVRVSFTTSGLIGVVRPIEPTDVEPLPVLTDPATAANAGNDGRLALTVAGTPVAARIVAVLRRFPTLGGGGFIVADETVLATALDAGAPGAGAADEVWLAGRRVAALPAAASEGLSFAVRSVLAHRLAHAPASRAVLGALFVGVALCAVLAPLGLLVVLLGSFRDAAAERDLADQGAGPRLLRRELRLRFVVAGGVAAVAGAGFAWPLGRLDRRRPPGDRRTRFRRAAAGRRHPGPEPSRVGGRGPGTGARAAGGLPRGRWWQGEPGGGRAQQRVLRASQRRGRRRRPPGSFAAGGRRRDPRGPRAERRRQEHAAKRARRSSDTVSGRRPRPR